MEMAMEMQEMDISISDTEVEKLMEGAYDEDT